jgi:hypothetical protein
MKERESLVGGSPRERESKEKRWKVWLSSEGEAFQTCVGGCLYKMWIVGQEGWEAELVVGGGDGGWSGWGGWVPFDACKDF